MDNLTPEDRSWCMSQIRSKGMKPELAVHSMVHRLGFRFRLHRQDLPGRPDLVLPRHRAVIFVNGCFWHWHPDPDCPIAGLPKSNIQYWKPKLARTRKRDIEHTASLLDKGWRVLTVWECQLRHPVDVLDQIHRFLSTANNYAIPQCIRKGV
ncbi:MAG: very short patch repair endonuclease [Candidatus Poribacteria bacterium]|nr:very short patch repair endonuclease [Candidatus Poribacteria bacterium]